MNDVIIISGSPGSGKTTVARLLAETYPRAVHLHTDDFWHAIVRGGVPPYLPEADQQNQTVVGSIAAAAVGYASGGFTTIVDGVVGPWMLHHYRAAVAPHPDVALRSIRLHYVVLRPDRATALRRAQSRTAADALIDEQPILALWEQFGELGDLAGHAIETTRLDAVETAQLVRRQLESGRTRLS